MNTLTKSRVIAKNFNFRFPIQATESQPDFFVSDGLKKDLDAALLNVKTRKNNFRVLLSRLRKKYAVG